MAFFELNSAITIGNYTFKGVHDVRVRRSLRSYTDAAWIRLPSKGFIQKGANTEEVTTGNLFQDGDKVVIKLGYNGDLKTEFEGFVKRRNLAMPLEIECEGYCRQLRLDVNMKGNYQEVTLKKLLTDMCKGTDIKVDCKVDITFTGLRMADADGYAVLEHVKRMTQNALTIFFIEPKLLWVGLTSTPYLAGTKVFSLPTVSYRLGYNAIKDSDLKERVPNEKVVVVINGVTVSGDPVRTQSKDKVAKRREKYFLNNVKGEAALKSIAEELANVRNYTGYEGSINGFLQPFAEPGYDAVIKDSRYPLLDGTYLVESTDVTFGVNGARRRVGIGPKLK